MRDWNTTYIDIATLIALHSYDTDRKVGCILVKDKRIISTGFNGTPSGFDNNCKDENGNTKPEVLHAESNAISKCAKSIESSEGSVLYTTLSPCLECAKLIIQSGIKEVYFADYYKDPAGIKLLEKAKINVTKITITL